MASERIFFPSTVGYTEADLNALPSIPAIPELNFKGINTWNILLLFALNPKLYFTTKQVSEEYPGINYRQIRRTIQSCLEIEYIKSKIWDGTDLKVYQFNSELHNAIISPES